MSKFKQDFAFHRRSAEAEKIRTRYPDRIPIICEKSPHTTIPDIDKKKFLVPSDLNIGQFAYVIRKRIELSSDQAVFIFINNTLPQTSALISEVYEKHRDKDGFLYVTYSGENVFG